MKLFHCVLTMKEIRMKVKMNRNAIPIEDVMRREQNVSVNRTGRRGGGMIPIYGSSSRSKGPFASSQLPGSQWPEPEASGLDGECTRDKASACAFQRSLAASADSWRFWAVRDLFPLAPGAVQQGNTTEKTWTNLKKRIQCSKSINQSINQSINRSTNNRTIRQLIDQSIAVKHSHPWGGSWWWQTTAFPHPILWSETPDRILAAVEWGYTAQTPGYCKTSPHTRPGDCHIWNQNPHDYKSLLDNPFSMRIEVRKNNSAIMILTYHQMPSFWTQSPAWSATSPDRSLDGVKWPPNTNSPRRLDSNPLRTRWTHY